MSESDFVYAVNEQTNLVSEIPRSYLTIYPTFRELSADDLAALRRSAEIQMFGEQITPATNAEAAVPSAEVPNEEGSIS